MTPRRIGVALIAAHFLLLLVLDTRHLGVVFYGETALVASAFCLRYVLHNPWRSTPEGRHLMYFTFCVATFMWFALAVTLNPDLPGREYFRLLLLGMLLHNLWVRNLLLTDANRQ